MMHKHQHRDADAVAGGCSALSADMSLTIYFPTADAARPRTELRLGRAPSGVVRHRCAVSERPRVNGRPDPRWGRCTPSGNRSLTIYLPTHAVARRTPPLASLRPELAPGARKGHAGPESRRFLATVCARCTKRPPRRRLLADVCTRCKPQELGRRDDFRRGGVPRRGSRGAPKRPGRLGHPSCLARSAARPTARRCAPRPGSRRARSRRRAGSTGADAAG